MSSKSHPLFKTLEKNVKPGRTVCASGLSTINKSNIIYALCRLKGVTAFCLASDEKEAQTLCNDLSCMGLRAYVYPVRDFNFLDFRAVRTSTNTQDLKFCSNFSTTNAMLQLRVLMRRHSLPFREMCLNSRLLNLKRAGSSHLKRRQRRLLCSATNALMR